MPTPQGTLDWTALTDDPDAVAPAVADAVRAGAVPTARLARIDPELSDTAAFCEAYDVDVQATANCVVVQGRRGERVTTAAVLVLAADRADINTTVRKHLDARKVSFADQEETERRTGMTSGGITPVGLPAEWPIWIDPRVAEAEALCIGSGLRSSKLIVSGADLVSLPGAEVVEGVGELRSAGVDVPPL